MNPKEALEHFFDILLWTQPVLHSRVFEKMNCLQLSYTIALISFILNDVHQNLGYVMNNSKPMEIHDFSYFLLCHILANLYPFWDTFGTLRSSNRSIFLKNEILRKSRRRGLVEKVVSLSFVRSFIPSSR